MKAIRMLFVIVAAVFLMGAFGPRNAYVTWDAPTTDIEGNPEILASADLGIWIAGTPIGNPPLWTKTGLNPNPGASGIPFTEIISGMSPTLPPGRYDFRVRVLDLAGNVSEWSEAYTDAYDPNPPKPPSAPKCNKS